MRCSGGIWRCFQPLFCLFCLKVQYEYYMMPSLSGFFFCSLAFCFDTDTSICGKIAMYLQNKHAATHSQYPADIDQVFRVSKEGENERNNAFSIKDKLLLSVKLVKFTIKTSMIHILTAFISLE